MAVTFADVARSEYILLTTFTRDGRPKPTAIWAAPRGDGLIAITGENSWKVKRIRHTARVTIAPCTRGGEPLGDAAEATAVILDKSANLATYDALGERYGFVGKAFGVFSRLRGGMSRNVTIELAAAPGPGGTDAP